jgi:hypothetical protein
VPWPDQAGEWIFHLSKALTGSDGMRLEGTYGQRVVVAGPAGAEWPSRLLVRPDPEGIRCAVASDAGAASEAEVWRWREAAASAAAEVGRHDQDFVWQAILGPNPRRMDIIRESPLAGPARLGPVLLEPGGIQMRERAGSTQADISPYLPRYSWPVIASGSVRSFHPLAADTKGKFDVHRACALLTLFWREHWLPRTGPQVPLPGWPRAPLQVPQSVGEWDHIEPDSSLPAGFNAYDGTEPPLAIPEWAEGAWAALDSDPVLATAVSAHYEARSLDYDHPSAAFLGYVAAIEGIGSQFADLVHCEKCGAHTGAGRRFREALRTVLTPKEVRRLGYAYDVRSQTAHSGALFGTEETLGFGHMSPFEYDLGDAFSLFMVGEIRNASRRVVTRALMNALGIEASAGQPE